jgi:glycosyltransferase involved in cell wall biosynthesis
MAPVRVLHVVGRMDRGGVETWLVQLLRAVDPDRVRMEFLSSSAEPAHYQGEIASLGSAIIPCERPTAPPRYVRRFQRVLRARGPYHVVHSHLHHFSGLVLAVAARERVPVRIAHSHLDTLRVDAAAGLPRRLYLRAMRAAIRRHATHGLAASEPAAEALFGERWREDGRWTIARYGLDLTPFQAPVDVAAVRASLGVSAGALVVGHVGRFDPQKNHSLLVRIADEVIRREPRAAFVLVGTGPLRPTVEAEVERRGLSGRVIFAGVRSDVPRLLRAFDALLFPSLHEGLPLVGLEAQAAGLPAVLSDSITRELAVLPELLTWRSLADPVQAWAESVLAAARSANRPRDPVGALERSEFSLARSLATLLHVYGLPPARVARSA